MATITSKGKLNIGYKGSMFKTPKCEYELTHVLPEGESPEETKLLVEAFKKLYTKGFAKLSKDRASAIRKAMDQTEKDWTKKPPKNIDAATKVANSAIEQGVKIWRDIEIVKLADQCIENVYAYMEKKLKKKINRKKAKTVLKIVVLVLIVVAAAAISIATAGLAAPLAGGVTAGVVIGMIGTGGTALVKSGQIIYKEYQNYEGYLDKIQKDIDAINKAVAYQEKKKGFTKLGPKEKIKLLMSGTKSHAKSLKKHLADAEARLILVRKENHKAILDAAEAEENFNKMTKIENQAASAEAVKAKDLAARTKRAVEKFEEKLKKFEQMKKEANTQLDMLDKRGDWNGEKVTGLMKFVSDHKEFAASVATGGKAIFTAGKKLHKVLA